MGNISINNVLAARNAILERNTALRNVATSPGGIVGPGAVGRPSFESAMNAALQKSNGPGEIGGPNRVAGIGQTENSQQTSFASTFNAQIQNVNKLDEEDGALAEAYERGETTDIAKVMLAGQRSSIAFEATLQVRNKLLSAYKDVMSMQI